MKLLILAFLGLCTFDVYSQNGAVEQEQVLSEINHSKSEFYNQVLGTFEVYPKGARAISINYELIEEIDAKRLQNEDFVLELEGMNVIIYSEERISSDTFVKSDKLIIKEK